MFEVKKSLGVTMTFKPLSRNIDVCYPKGPVYSSCN